MRPMLLKRCYGQDRHGRGKIDIGKLRAADLAPAPPTLPVRPSGCHVTQLPQMKTEAKGLFACMAIRKPPV